MSPEEHSEFWRKVQFTVDKDVVRTDRSNQFFRGENNPNVEIMRYSNTAAPFVSHPLSFPPVHSTLSLTYTVYFIFRAANEFHALLTLTKPSEHFRLVLAANGFLNEEQEDLNRELVIFATLVETPGVCLGVILHLKPACGFLVLISRTHVCLVRLLLNCCGAEGPDVLVYQELIKFLL